MCEDSIGRLQVIRAGDFFSFLINADVVSGGVRIFIMHLPPRNRNIEYTTRIYADWFSWVTVAETAVKALYYLSFDDNGKSEMRTTATMKALRFVKNQNSFPDHARVRSSLFHCM